MLTTYITYWFRMAKTALIGSKLYYLWLTFLSAVSLTGLYYYYHQLQSGLITTNLTNEVSWGAYIANFTYVDGIAAAVVLLVAAAFIYKNKAVQEVVIIGQLLAFSAILMCLLFITVDLGRPDRFWHIIPLIGKLNFPRSILAWDVVVLNFYLVINMHIPGYLLYCLYKGKEAKPKFYLPFVFLCILGALGIQTVTAFLHAGLGGRPFWNTAILAPRFIVGAFTCGPAIMILAFAAINFCYKNFKIKDEVFDLLKTTLSFTMPLNIFLLLCELFKEFYTDSVHVISTQYLFFGIDGHNKLVPYIWTAVAFNIFSAIVYTTKLKENRNLLLFTCLLTVFGTWVEKGMGLIIPAFIPSSLGDIVEYTPSIGEFWISAAIWSFGILVFTINAKVCISILTGELRNKA